MSTSTGVITNRQAAERGVGGEVIAESRRPTVLFETGLPPRFYLPEEDVRMDLLALSTTETSCPYKGTTSRYYSADVDGERVEDVAWVYDEVHAEVHGIEGLIAFYHEKVGLEVDGAPWAGRPATPGR